MGWLGSLALSRNWPFVVIPEMKDHAEPLSKIVFAYLKFYSNNISHLRSYSAHWVLTKISE